jgi:FGGY-family pentulose kinase
MSDRFVVAVDVGTGSARAGVFRASDGAKLGYATHPIQIWRPRTDFAQHSSRDIWDAVGSSVREAIAQSGLAKEAIVGLAFDATCSLVVLDQQGRPLTVSPDGEPDQDTIVWMDHRAVAEADLINAEPHDVLRYVGGAISPEMEPPKLLWLKRHLPKTWSQAGKFFDLADFLAYASTGSDVRSLCTHVCKWTYLGHEDRWDDGFLEAIGLDDLRTGAKAGDRIRPLGEPIGNLTPDAAAHLGLSEHCVVGVGAIDAHAGGIGLLGASLDPSRPETTLALIGGTSNCHMAASREACFVPGVWGPYFGAMVPGLWLTEGGQSAAGSLIDFAIDSGSGIAQLREDARRSGRTVYEILNDRVDALCRTTGVSNPALLTKDLHILDFHLGNRSPFADPHARGVVDGLPLDRNYDTDTRMYVATIEAVAYGTRAIVDAMNRSGFSIQRIVATGGGTKNPLWMQLHADATGLPISVGNEPESVLLGTAMLAAAAAGCHPNVQSAMSAMGSVGDTIAPDPAMRAFHDAKFSIWNDLYQSQLRHRATMSQF